MGLGGETEISQIQQADSVGSIAPCTIGHAAELRRNGSGMTWKTLGVVSVVAWELQDRRRELRSRLNLEHLWA